MDERRRFETFRDFYRYYLSEHTHPTCRRLHFAGSALGVFIVVTAFVTGRWGYAFMAIPVGYALAWTGHFFFERNRPATFRYPIFSFVGDWVMFKDMLAGRIKW